MSKIVKYIFALIVGGGIIAAVGLKLHHSEPDYRALWVKRVGGTNSLALTQIITGEEPYVFTFTIPLNFEVMTFEDSRDSSNHCWLGLSDNGRYSEGIIYRRTNNGYLIRFDSSFAPTGEVHVLKIALVTGFYRIFGPPLTVAYTNLFQLDQNLFGGGGVWLRCHLGVERAGYKINIYDTNRDILNAITGQTTNGTIDEVWDFKTSDGVVRNDDEFYTDFYIWRLHSGANENTNGNVLIPTNPCLYNYIRDKSGRFAQH
jgi:hypothetical protein